MAVGAMRLGRVVVCVHVVVVTIIRKNFVRVDVGDVNGAVVGRRRDELAILRNRKRGNEAGVKIEGESLFHGTQRNLHI